MNAALPELVSIVLSFKSVPPRVWKSCLQRFSYSKETEEQLSIQELCKKYGAQGLLDDHAIDDNPDTAGGGVEGSQDINDNHAAGIPFLEQPPKDDAGFENLPPLSDE